MDSKENYGSITLNFNIRDLTITGRRTQEGSNQFGETEGQNDTDDKTRNSKQPNIGLGTTGTTINITQNFYLRDGTVTARKTGVHLSEEENGSRVPSDANIKTTNSLQPNNVIGITGTTDNIVRDLNFEDGKVTDDWKGRSTRAKKFNDDTAKDGTDGKNGYHKKANFELGATSSKSSAIPSKAIPEEILQRYNDHINKPNDFFQMTKTPKGIVRVFNNMCGNEKAGQERKGSEKDIDILESLFQEISNCDYKLYENLPALDMKDKLENLTNSEREASFYAIFIMSHGERDEASSADLIRGQDGTIIDAKEIVDLFNVEYLKNIPVLFFFNACRGRAEDDAGYEPIESYADTIDGEFVNDILTESTDLDQALTNSLMKTLPFGKILGHISKDEIDACPHLYAERDERDETDRAENEYVESHKNIFVSFSAAEKHVSVRNKDSGSWYIQEICKELRKRASDTDFLTMMNTVHGNLYHNIRRPSFPRYRFAARASHTLENKKLMFFPGI